MNDVVALWWSEDRAVMNDVVDGLWVALMLRFKLIAPMLWRSEVFSPASSKTTELVRPRPLTRKIPACRSGRWGWNEVL